MQMTMSVLEKESKTRSLEGRAKVKLSEEKTLLAGETPEWVFGVRETIAGCLGGNGRRNQS
jgi:hypothetical protein